MERYILYLILTVVHGCPEKCVCVDELAAVYCQDLKYFPYFTHTESSSTVLLEITNSTLGNFHMIQSHWPSITHLDVRNCSLSCVWVDHAKTFIDIVLSDCGRVTAEIESEDTNKQINKVCITLTTIQVSAVVSLALYALGRYVRKRLQSETYVTPHPEQPLETRV